MRRTLLLCMWCCSRGMPSRRARRLPALCLVRTLHVRTTCTRREDCIGFLHKYLAYCTGSLVLPHCHNYCFTAIGIYHMKPWYNSIPASAKASTLPTALANQGAQMLQSCRSLRGNYSIHWSADCSTWRYRSPPDPWAPAATAFARQAGCSRCRSFRCTCQECGHGPRWMADRMRHRCSSAWRPTACGARGSERTHVCVCMHFCVCDGSSGGLSGRQRAGS